jgi:cation:H+ antiporter
VVLRKELPILLAVTVLAGAVMLDNDLSRWDAAVLLGAFAVLMGWSIYQGMRGSPDALADETAHELDVHAMPLRTALLWLVAGLILLIVSSRLLVWGAVSVAQTLGVSDLVIGLTIVAVGTSLPELASCLAAAKKGEHDIALGNILGSNLFNTMAVVGLAGMVAPTATDPALLWRDWPVMAGMTVLMFVMAMGWRGRQGQINRWEGGLLILAYIAYVAWLLQSVRTTA